MQNVNSTMLEQTFPIKLNWVLSDFKHMQMLDEKVWGLRNSSSLTAYKADVFMSAEVEPLEIQAAGRSESGPKQSVRV